MMAFSPSTRIIEYGYQELYDSENDIVFESEFYKNGTPIYSATGELKDIILLPCIEIVISRNHN